MEEFRLVIDIVNTYIRHKREKSGILSNGYIDYFTSWEDASESVKAYKRHWLNICYIDGKSKSYILNRFDTVCNEVTKSTALEDMMNKAGEYLLLLLESHSGEQIIHDTYEGMEY